MHTDQHMTGAELQTLREACGLSREDVGDLAGVAARTVKHWENGRAGVPADVAAIVCRLDAMASLAAHEDLTALRAAAGRVPGDVVMVRYRDPQDLKRYRPDLAGLPTALHGSIINRMRLTLAQLAGLERVAVRVVWMEPEAFEAWRSAQKLPDSETTRSQWAAQQIDAQATAHRRDQPPG